MHVVTIDADGTIVQLDWSALGRGGHQRPDKRRLAHLQHNVMKHTCVYHTRALHKLTEYLKALKKKTIYTIDGRNEGGTYCSFTDDKYSNGTTGSFVLAHKILNK